MPSDAPSLPAAGTALSDEDVVGRVIAGETALFEVIMRRHNARLFRMIRSIVKDGTEAEDVMQQAYLSAYRHLGQFAGAARFSTWLTRIALTEAWRRSKSQRRFVPLAEGGGLEPQVRVTPEDTVGNREMIVILEQALDALPDIYSSVFVLREVEGLSTAETAEALDVSEETIKVRLHRAKTDLREALFARAGGAAAGVYSFHLSRCDAIVARVLAAISP